MDKKIIFLDIDGTLTEPGCNEPPQSAIEAIHKAQGKGHYVYLATGRNYDMLSPLLQYGFDGVIASAGGYILHGDTVLYDCPMTEEQKERAMKVLKENDIFQTIECKEGSFTDEGFHKFLKEHAGEGANSEMLRWREQIEKRLHVRPLSEYEGQPVYKIVVMCKEKSQLIRAERTLGEEFEFCIQSEEQYGFVNAEIINRKFDKGMAVRRVCNYLHVLNKDTIAFGDSMNDKEMLETAGLSICMKNGNAVLKTVADDICPSVVDDGIYRAFEKYELL